MFYFLLIILPILLFFFFFFNDTATTEIYTLSLHDALPLCDFDATKTWWLSPPLQTSGPRSEEHTSELQSPVHLVCRLLLEKKKKHKLSLILQKKKKKIKINYLNTYKN